MSVRCLFDAAGSQAGQTLPLKGLYLGLNLHRRTGADGLSIHANYIASLDGRIAVWSRERDDFEVPKQLANARDWRLYQELAAQSDIMLTSARYFRQLDRGHAQDLLPVGRGHADLLDWRAGQGMRPQPDVAVLSHSLAIPERVLAAVQDRRIVVLTDEQAEDARVQSLERLGVSVLCCGRQRVEGPALRRALSGMGYRSAYMIAGPEVFRTLLDACCLDRLFLTTRLRLLGGARVHTLLDADLKRFVDLQPLSLYLDEADSPGQIFAHYALRRH